MKNVLGRKSLPQQVWTVHRQLAEVSSQFKFLLQVYGGEEPALLQLAREILGHPPPAETDSGVMVGAQALARRASKRSGTIAAS